MMRRSAEETGHGPPGARGTSSVPRGIALGVPNTGAVSLLNERHLLEAMPERKAKSLSLSECHIADEVLAIGNEVVARDQGLEAADRSDRVFQLAEHLEAELPPCPAGLRPH